MAACERAFSDVLLLQPPGIQQAQQDLLIADWENSKQLIITTVTEKLDFWQRLPWLLCGLGHWSAEQRQACARKVVDAVSMEPRAELHHRMTRPWLEGRLYEDTRLLAAGIPFEQLSSESVTPVHRPGARSVQDRNPCVE